MRSSNWQNFDLYWEPKRATLHSVMPKLIYPGQVRLLMNGSPALLLPENTSNDIFDS